MKFGVITFPGSNCDQDMIYVLKDILGQEVEELWHKDTDLKGVMRLFCQEGFLMGIIYVLVQLQDFHLL